MDSSIYGTSKNHIYGYGALHESYLCSYREGKDQRTLYSKLFPMWCLFAQGQKRLYSSLFSLSGNLQQNHIHHLHPKGCIWCIWFWAPYSAFLLMVVSGVNG